MKCPKGHGEMLIRQDATAEQAGQGTWLDCPDCMASVLIPSLGMCSHCGRIEHLYDGICHACERSMSA